ncbi:TPA: hypothetical protein ACH3X1_004537 [Trebouxia sp. C0004]
MGTQAPSQLSQTDEEAEKRWESMNEIDLDAEIDAYRVSLRDTSERLTAIGISPDWEGGQLSAGASDRGSRLWMTYIQVNGRFHHIAYPYTPMSLPMIGSHWPRPRNLT